MRATSFSWAQGQTCHVSCHMPVVSCLCESSHSPTLLEPQLPAVALATPPVPATTLPLNNPLPLTTLPLLCLPNTPCDDYSITSDAQISGSHDTRRQCTLPLPKSTWHHVQLHHQPLLETGPEVSVTPRQSL